MQVRLSKHQKRVIARHRHCDVLKALRFMLHHVPPPSTHPTRRFVADTTDSYHLPDGHTLKREYGQTPNGNPVGGRWVLRAPDGAWIDVDQYRYDVAERHGFSV